MRKGAVQEQAGPTPHHGPEEGRHKSLPILTWQEREPHRVRRAGEQLCGRPQGPRASPAPPWFSPSCINRPHVVASSPRTPR